MVRVWRIVAAVVVVCLVLQPGCGGPDGSPSIPETTVVLDETTLDHLSYVSEDFSTLIFEHSTEQLSSLSAGDVIVCGVSEATPYGLLRRVTSVDVGDEETTVETAFATLEEAIEECDVSGTWSLLPDGSAVPLGAVATATCTGWYIDIDDIVMAEAGSVRVVARGSICADIDLDFRLKIKSWNLREAHFSLTTAETAELEIAIEGAIEVLDGKWELYRQYMNPIVLWVGLMPVVITPVLTFNVGVDAKVYHGVTTSITQEAEVTVGVSYIQGTWSPVTEHSAAFGWDAPSLSTGCSVKGYVGPQLSLLLYGITGPYGEIRGYGKLEADILANPWWSLYGGVEARVGARIEILGHDIADYEVPAAIGYRVLLAQAETETAVYFPDPNLEAAIREAIGKPTGDVYPADLEGLTTLYAWEKSIIDLSGLEYCTALSWVTFRNNQISDISSLVSNPGLGEGDTVDLRNNSLSAQSIDVYIPQLQDRGVTVYYVHNPKPKTYTEPPPFIIDTTKQYTAIIETVKGNLVLELFASDVPVTVNNFVFLSRDGFYDDLWFHRVIADFVAQAGCPVGDGTGDPGYMFDNEITEHTHVTGALSMAHHGPNTNGCQFFITYSPQHHLDGVHPVFGQLLEGMDVLESLEPTVWAPGDVIIRVTIEEG